MKDAKFIIIILLFFFGAGIMAEIEHYDNSVNNTGIMYQENDNIVLNENNTLYNYGINYDLDESYLQYNPVKKYSFLDNSKNLASPDLTDKEYLGNGNYRLYTLLSGIIVDYNVNSGIFTVNGQTNSYSFTVKLFDLLSNQLYTASYYYVSGSINNQIQLFYRLPLIGYLNRTGSNYQIDFSVSTTITSQNEYVLYATNEVIFNNFQFKLQLEKGSTATPYQLPYIPALKIDFKGSNQVEYINPYKSQTIKIDDINNVDEIEFELINVINPVVFNWNITTNPDIPFVRFYNNQTKLLYDFTDIDEINKIGNNLVASQSNFINLVDSALGLVDTFYRGFQSLFNKKFIDTIADYLRNGMTLPFMPTNFPWFK